MIRIYKPNSVTPKNQGGNYLSRPNIAVWLQRSTRKHYGRTTRFQRKERFLLDLAPGGACLDPEIFGIPIKGTTAITDDAVGSYPAFSPLPRKAGAVYFLWRYP